MSGDVGNIEAAARITSRLADIEKAYHEAGGSFNISMGEIRSQFTEVLPFNSKNWYRHWSNFAIRLVRLDKEAGRPIFRNVLPIPTSTPRSNEDKLYIFNTCQDLLPPVSGVPVVENQPTSNTLSSDHGVLSNEQRIAILSKQNIDNQNRINSLLASHDSNEKGKRKKHHKRKDDSSDSSSDSSTKSEKNARKFAFISKKKTVDIPIGNFTPGALLYAADVKGYDSCISQAVKSFNNSVKPSDFPDVLTKELLLGKFIDLRRIKGELLNPKKGDTSYLVSEWLYYFGILKKAIKAAFPDCESFVSEYGKYIKSQFWSSGIMAQWRNIAGYDAAFRTQVANRRYICFSDWDHKDCEVLKTQFFGSAFSQHGFGNVVPFNPIGSSMFQVWLFCLFSGWSNICF
ncbi:hypothetical protein DFH28DRAFT_1185665 [Melampsora americana]|nr:hypothetical protein DFH28DRAFT_1185665 [Melampsora americana]